MKNKDFDFDKQDMDNIILQDMENIYARDLSYDVLRGKSILITGATGMLASYVVYFLLWLNERHDYKIKIIALVRNQEKCRMRFGKYMDKEYFSVREDDICTPLQIDGSIDYIIHAASLASPQYYGRCPVEVAAPNVLGTYHLLQLAREKQSQGVLFFSSGDIYGEMPADIGAFIEDEKGKMDPLAPHSCYGESKRMGENFCVSFAREYGVPARIVRIGHTYAPTMDVENDPRVFASFMKCLIANEDIVMLSDGRAMRPFCYVADAVAAFFLVLLKGKNGEAYNVCNDQQLLSILELAEILVSLMPEKNLKVVRKHRSENDFYMENVINKANCPSSEKLRSLGWEIQFGVRSGFLRVLQYFQKNEMLQDNIGRDC